ncbi:hypothetical protein ABZ820_33745 [Streptomyces diacarni]|uniref:hypothetical protein n=1 Tax=Streptomyces diacarni TaxID=2800381 RepID=UPI0033C2B46F
MTDRRPLGTGPTRAMPNRPAGAAPGTRLAAERLDQQDEYEVDTAPATPQGRRRTLGTGNSGRRTTSREAK